MRQLGTNISQTAPARLSAVQAAQLRALQAQKRVTAYPYYSTVTFYLDKIGEPPGPYEYRLARGEERRAFSYGKGEAMVNAGAPTVVATPAETNLVQAAETISGESVEIHGMAIMLKQSGLVTHEAALPALLSEISSHVSIDLSLNGDQNRFHLGTVQQIPGAGGVIGAQKDLTGQTSLVGIGQEYPFASNAWPVRSCFFRMPEGLIWRSKGHADSQLNVIFRVERELEIYSGGNVANNANGLDVERDLVSQIQGYNYPTQIELTLLVHLMGRVVGPRTRSA